MSAKLMDSGGGLMLHWCPGCGQEHRIPTVTPFDNGALWTYNGNAQRPTFQLSINIVGRCHYYLIDGQLQYLADSKHALAGRTIELPDIPEDVMEFWK